VIKEIYESSPELATDMWLIICLAIRSTDLMKIVLFVDQKPILNVKIKEKKNKNRI